MRTFLRLRQVLVCLLLALSLAYLPVSFAAVQLFAPLSACQIPLLPAFGGVSFGYVLYALLLLGAVVLMLCSLGEKNSVKVRFWLLPLGFLVLDIVGQVFCYQSLSFADMTLDEMQAYYYFNGISPTPAWYFLVSIAMDVLLAVLLVTPSIAARIRQSKRAREQSDATPEGVLAVDSLDVLLAESERAALEEEHNPSGQSE